jgi:hypothetical protein
MTCTTAVHDLMEEGRFEIQPGLAVLLTVEDLTIEFARHALTDPLEVTVHGRFSRQC